jgi:hypothetical protein
MGSGYRTFTAGEVLTASNVQNFLQDQVVMVFADSTARATSIGTANFEEGMVSYLENSDTVEVYNGTTWGSIAPVSSQGLTLINTTTFSGVSSQSINDVFSATYENYKIVWYWTQAGGGATPFIRLRNGGVNESSSIYYSNEITTQSSLTTLTNTSRDPISNIVFGPSEPSGNFLEMTLFNPFAAARKGYLIQKVGSSATETNLGWSNGIVDRNTSCDGIHFEINANTMSGTIRIYGLA